MAGLFCALFAAACSSDTTPSSPRVEAGTAPDAGAVPDSSATPADAGDPACDAFAERLQTGLDGERTKQKVKHASLGVWTERCGTRIVVSSTGGQPPVTPDALWKIGSETKMFTSVAILRLIELGKFQLDDPIDKWFPAFPRASTLTVRHLLNHTSGIANYTELKKFSELIASAPLAETDPQVFIDWAAAEPPLNEPGAAWSYSNTNYILLGRILELVTGEKAVTVIRREAIERAGLRHTFLLGSEPIVGKLARGYLNGSEMTEAYSPSIAWTAGAMVTTPEDALAWVRAVYMDKKMVSPALFTQMTTSFPKAGYGLGTMVLTKAQSGGIGEGFGHNGSIFGYLSQAMAFPTAKVAIASTVGDSAGDPNALSILAVEAVKELLQAP